MHIDEMTCCGIREFHGLNNEDTSAEDCLGWIGHYIDNFGECFAFLALTEVVEWSDDGEDDDDYGLHDGVGAEVMALIKRHKLGETTTLEPQKNPNSQNIVQPYLWRVNSKLLTKWARNTDVYKREEKARESWSNREQF